MAIASRAISFNADTTNGLSAFKVYCILFIAFLLETELGRIAGFRAELLLSVLVSVFYIVGVAYSTNFRITVVTTLLTVPALLYFGFLLSSAIWSVAPIQSFLYGALFCLFILTCTIGPAVPLKYVAINTIKAIAMICVLSWVFYAVAGGAALSDKDVAWRLKGIMAHEQRLALFCGIGIILSYFYRLQLSRTTILFSLAIFVITLLATQARAFTIFVILVIGVINVVESKGFKKLISVMILAVAAIGFYGVSSTVADKFSRGANDQTLSGRTTIWEHTLYRSQERPYFGFGFGSFLEEGVANQIFQSYSPPHAHNTFVHSLFETGKIGTLLLIVWMLSLANTSSANRLASYLIFFSVLCGMMGIIFGSKMTGTALLVVFIISSACTIVKKNELSK
ncbi:O-antigen ligase family protein [Ningiella sp. W23]|uniref:O-antigen ligase family protein n=1 Tax=Ningiella sp. W23 TaxID=3023715 RepID=UPI00375779B1